MNECPLCKAECLEEFYNMPSIPVFQNKTYKTQLEAQKVQTGQVKLFHCLRCDYIFNALFDYLLMNYDDSYQNDQSTSSYFQNYLHSIVDLLIEKGFKNKKIVEIGCGKGIFLEKLWELGFDAIGFDPAYEGKDFRIVKDYFSNKYCEIEADLVIMRHTLEHIGDPLKFLGRISNVVKKECLVFVEVPDFEWIVDKGAFWDIFYEHCNYFTKQSLSNCFKTSTSGSLFGGQYQYVLSSFSELRQKATRTNSPINKVGLKDKLTLLKSLILSISGDIYLWGAGAKGATFANLLDPDCQKISAIIDISEKKQGRFIGGTGHKVVSPQQLFKSNSKGSVLIMNENYKSEINKFLEGSEFNSLCIDEITKF